MTLPTILEAIRQAPPEDLPAVWEELALRAGEQSSPMLVADRAGRTLGYFFGVEAVPPPPPDDTPEERAELQRRLDSIDRTYSTEELKEFIRQGDHV
jgi:hypothetical protein